MTDLVLFDSIRPGQQFLFMSGLKDLVKTIYEGSTKYCYTTKIGLLQIRFTTF